ncbi:hypothetical protein, partial [Kineococcus sp. SYSU DK001]|uniref:hypothetical protein n=1 Tax=Kineococcus sp. SYSU DK001 TaxID=3383122 RepID=UPI003D7C7CAC
CVRFLRTQQCAINVDANALTPNDRSSCVVGGWGFLWDLPLFWLASSGQGLESKVNYEVK